MDSMNQEKTEVGNEKTISRRDFLKGMVNSLGALTIARTPFLNELIESIDKTDNSFSEVAQSYIAKDPTQAEEVAKRIRVDRNASASNICGPLATSILLGWYLNEDGSVSNRSTNKDIKNRMEGVSPGDLWLGSPENDPNRYKIAFPETHYNSFHIRESIGTLDFDKIPGVGSLKPGDFLYLDGGSFTHYIAISRRDQEGRIYCVSNIHGEKPGEFIIDEVMLWDPYEKNGFFRNWAKGVGAERARTGLKGFYLWRRKNEAEYLRDDSQTIVCRNLLTNEMRKQKKGNWNINIFESGMGQVFEWRNSVPFRSNSAINLPLAVISLNLIKETYSEQIEKEGLESFVKRMGYNGKTFEQLITSSLINSDKDASDLLARFCSSKKNLEKEFIKLGLNSTKYESKRTSQRDIQKCWINIFTGENIDRDSSNLIKKILEEKSQIDEGILNEIKKKFTGSRVWNIKTFIGGDYTCIQDCGVIQITQGNINRYLLVGLSGISRGSGDLKYSDGKAFSSSFASILSNYLENTKQKAKSSI